MNVIKSSSINHRFALIEILYTPLLSVDVFYELRLKTSATSLTIYPKRCYATPTKDPLHKVQYTFIKDGYAFSLYSIFATFACQQLKYSELFCDPDLKACFSLFIAFPFILKVYQR